MIDVLLIIQDVSIIQYKSVSTVMKQSRVKIIY